VITLGLGLILLGAAAWLFITGPTPPSATLADATRAAASSTAPTLPEWELLETGAANGDPVAMNNLGVALWRTRQRKAQAQAWFEKAAAKGNVAARYNLALYLPDRHTTNPEIIRKRLHLLEQNVEAGDIPSMVALARALYFKNRDDYVPDRKELRRDLLRRAAATGDPDYLVTLGKTLWKDIRGGEDPALVGEALSALHAASKAGDPRGAETIAQILEDRSGVVRPLSSALLDQIGITDDPLFWYATAADMGLVTAKCSYGFEVFNTRSWLRSPDMSLIERHFRAGPDMLGNSPDILARAIAHLETCAANPKRSIGPRRPFGEPSLYAYKLRGTWTSMSTQPGWANITLGILHGYGIGVERDRDRALTYLDRAANAHDFSLAEQIMRNLPDF